MKQNLDKLKIGDKVFISINVRTGKYKTPTDAIESTSSGCEIVTVAIRRLPTDLKNDNTNF
jgi:thiazole synthase ThiGH ThiG subunit